jgi:hypothetical protein
LSARSERGVTPAVSSGGGNAGKKNLTRWSHLSARKNRKRKEGGRGLRVGSVAAGLVLPGSAQLGCLPFFFVLNPFLFLFSISFTTFVFVTQMTSNQKQMFSKIQGIKVGQ